MKNKNASPQRTHKRLVVPINYAGVEATEMHVALCGTYDLQGEAGTSTRWRDVNCKRCLTKRPKR
jgi:hypothetical protein